MGNEVVEKEDGAKRNLHRALKQSACQDNQTSHVTTFFIEDLRVCSISASLSSMYHVSPVQHVCGATAPR